MTVSEDLGAVPCLLDASGHTAHVGLVPYDSADPTYDEITLTVKDARSRWQLSVDFGKGGLQVTSYETWGRMSPADHGLVTAIVASVRPL